MRVLLPDNNSQIYYFRSYDLQRMRPTRHLMRLNLTTRHLPQYGSEILTSLLSKMRLYELYEHYEMIFLSAETVLEA